MKAYINAGISIDILAYKFYVNTHYYHGFFKKQVELRSDYTCWNTQLL